MKNLTDKLNFSTASQAPANAVKLHNRNRDIGYYYDNLCLYCANNGIELSHYDDNDFMASAEIMEQHGQSDISTDHYFF